MTESAFGGPAARSRTLRVFVSSTFRDMQAERDELAKRTFPSLRRLCQERGVTWADVDLRWGISTEEAADGDVLPICLGEIDRCRPYFICLLGERYGFVPPHVPEQLLAREPWLAEHEAKSITELEIVHGVLKARGDSTRAFFYFRDPGYVNRQPPTLQALYRETPTAEEISALGAAEAGRRCEVRRQKLARLKDAIRDRYRTGDVRWLLHEDYQNPTDLGALVLADFTVLIDALFPPQAEIDPLSEDTAAHESFAADRRQVYVARESGRRSGDERPDASGLSRGEGVSRESRLATTDTTVLRSSPPGRYD